ncbi:MAG: hypothetical protein P8Y63_15490, partial [Deltaproteobacteria bacterium]
NPTGSSGPNLLINLNGLLVFQANDGTNGQQLWKSDGTDSGTQLVKKIGSGLAMAGREYVVAGNTMYFRANDGLTGNELWKSNGTTAGTMLVKDIYPGSLPADSSSPDYFAHVGGKVFFGANDGVHGYELWITDGTADGTKMVKDINIGPGDGHEPT